MLLLVLLVVAVVGAAAVVGVMAVARQFELPSASSPAPLPPLLPGAPKLVLPPAPAAASGPVLGYDVSHPQCGSTLPSGGSFGIVGVNLGKGLSSNPCFKDQLAWASAKQGHAVYANSGFSGTGDPIAHGRALADDAVARERAAGLGGTTVWWLDVETVNTWAGTTQENATVIDAMAARLLTLGARVGIYSTPAMWEEIAGSWEPGLPVWYATGPGTQESAGGDCASGFAGSKAAIVQWVATDTDGELDHNLICLAYRNRVAELLDLG